MPEYFTDSPASLARFQQDISYRYWLPLHAVTLAALLGVTRRRVGRGTPGSPGLGLGGVRSMLAVTVVFFIPGVVAFNRVDVR
jgi:hypothetical protein